MSLLGMVPVPRFFRAVRETSRNASAEQEEKIELVITSHKYMWGQLSTHLLRNR